MNLNIDKTGWEKVKFGEVCRMINNTVKNIQSEGITHIVGLEHIEPNDLHIRSWNTPEKETTFTRKFCKGQVLFGRRRAYQRKVAYAEFDGICSGDILVFEAIETKLLPRLLTFIVQSEGFFTKAVDTSAGSLSPRTKFKDLAEYEFFLPPKEEQTRLAELLWTADEVVERERDYLKNLFDFKDSLLNKFIPPSTNESEILGNHIELQKGITYKSEDYSDKDNGVPLLNLKSVSRYGGLNIDGIKYFNANFKEEHIVKKEDVLIAVTDITREGNVIGYPIDLNNFIGKAVFTMDLCAIRMKSNKFLTKFLYYLFKTKWCHKYLMGYANGSTVLHLDISSIYKIKIPDLSIEEQMKIVNTLSDFDNHYKMIDSHIKISEILKQRLINEIF